MSITDLGIYEIILFALGYLLIAIILMYLSANDYAGEKSSRWWWIRWK